MMNNINRIKKTKKIYKKKYNKRGGTNVYEERTELVPFKTPDGEIRLIQKSAEAEYAQGKIKPNNFLMDLVPYTGKYNEKKKEGEMLLVTENTTTNIKNSPMIKKSPTIIKKKPAPPMIKKPPIIKKPIKPVPVPSALAPVPSALAPVKPIKFILPNVQPVVPNAPAPVTVPVPGPNVPATAAPAVTAAPAGVDYDLASPGEYDVGTADTASSYYSKGTANEEGPYGVAGVPAPVSHGVMANPNYEPGIPPPPESISEECQDIDWLAYIQSFEKLTQVLIDKNEIIKRFKNYKEDDYLKDKAKVEKKLKEFGFFNKGTKIFNYIDSEHTNYIKCLNEYNKSNNSFILNFLNSQKQAYYIEKIREIPNITDTLTNEKIDKLTTDPEINNFLKEIIKRNKIILSIQKYEYGYKTEGEVNTYIEKESISFLNKFVLYLPKFKVGDVVRYIEQLYRINYNSISEPYESNSPPSNPNTEYTDITIGFIGTIQKITFNESSYSNYSNYHYDIIINETTLENNNDTIKKGDELRVNSTKAKYLAKEEEQKPGANIGGSRKKKRITKRKKKYATKKKNTFKKSIAKHF